MSTDSGNGCVAQDEGAGRHRETQEEERRWWRRRCRRRGGSGISLSISLCLSLSRVD